MSRRGIALVVMILMATSAVFPASAKAEEFDEPVLLAARGPIIWHITDDEKRIRMENDLELLRLFNEANAAKDKRKKLGRALFYPGAVLVGAGFAAGLFQNAIGLYDEETGEYLMVGGFALGAALVTPGIYYSMKMSDEEKAYEQYMWDNYQEKPIMQIVPLHDGVYVSMRVGF